LSVAHFAERLDARQGRFLKGNGAGAGTCGALCQTLALFSVAQTKKGPFTWNKKMLQKKVF